MLNNVDNKGADKQISVSCIITNHNNENWIERAVKSVITQTCPVNEIIIADDASTDGSLDIIESLCKQHDNIVFIKREKNLGVVSNRDDAIRNAKGDIVTYLDSDDWFSPTKIENDLDALRKFGPYTVVVPDFVVVSPEGNELDRISTNDFCKATQETQWTWLLGRKRGTPNGPGIMLHKHFYQHVGGFRLNCRIYEDWDLQLRLLREGAVFASTDSYDYFYMRGHSSLSRCSKLIDLRYKWKVLVGCAQYNPPLKSIFFGLLNLFAIKPMKYLMGRARKHGFN